MHVFFLLSHSCHLQVAIALIESGMSAVDAIQRIRSKRRGALNSKQVQYLVHYKRRNELIKMSNSCNIL
jgi:protein tyrosine phosphatase type IVA